MGSCVCGGVLSRVSEIDNDAETVHLGHNFVPNAREAAVHRVLGLDVAEVVHPIVDKSDSAHPTSLGGREPTRIHAYEVATLARDEVATLAVGVNAFDVALVRRTSASITTMLSGFVAVSKL